MGDFHGFMDYTLVEGNNKVIVMGFGFEENTIKGYSISMSDPHSISGPVYLQPSHRYRVTSIACRDLNSTHMACALNTGSSFLIEAYINYDLTSIVEHRHDKYGYYEGYEVDLAGDYIYMFGKTAIPGVFSMAILSWKTKRAGGDGKLWAGLKLPIPNDDIVDLHYQAPFVAVHNASAANGEGHFCVATLYSDTPIGFFETSTFQLIVNDSNYDVSQLKIVYQGLSTTEIQVKDIFVRPSQDPASSWPFILIMIILVVLAVGWVGFTAFKSKEVSAPAEIAEGNYGTITSDQQKKTLKEDL